ncbi:MAG: hypothetical protein LIR46_14540 [Bacteroidota bacterium]|nr:hypothetical protein [Bacteroidota bacterium]
MIKITIATVKVDSSFVEEHPSFEEGENAYYVIRESGKRLSVFYHSEYDALMAAWAQVKQYGLTLVEPW